MNLRRPGEEGTAARVRVLDGGVDERATAGVVAGDVLGDALDEMMTPPNEWPMMIGLTGTRSTPSPTFGLTLGPFRSRGDLASL